MQAGSELRRSKDTESGRIKRPERRTETGGEMDTQRPDNSESAGASLCWTGFAVGVGVGEFVKGRDGVN